MSEIFTEETSIARATEKERDEVTFGERKTEREKDRRLDSVEYVRTRETDALFVRQVNRYGGIA